MELQKITKTDFGKSRRWYQDACGTALAMDLVGERWSMLIIRELLLGPRRFGEIRGGLVGLSANILAQRLEGLEKSGIIERRQLPSPSNTQVYALTKWGQAAEEPIFALSRWAAGSPAHDVRLPLSNTAFMLSLRTMMRRDADYLAPIDLGFRVGGEPFRAKIEAGMLEVVRIEPDGADVVFIGEPSPMASVFYGRDSLAESQRIGKVAVAGDIALGQRFVDLFQLPQFCAG
jgi:DNA-binding HxlR family transcriptional regulator